MKRAKKRHHKSAILILEETVQVLRSAPMALLPSFYLGSIPFVLGLFYFWADMSHNARAHEYRAVAALGLAISFVWMKYWHTVFALRVRSQLSGEPEMNWPLNRVLSIFATQTLIQSTRFIILPIAALLMIPFGYCYAFYQNATAHVDAEIQTVKSTTGWAWRQAKLWPRQNHLLICIFWIFGIVIFLNVSVTSLFIPQLLKSLFGIETKFTLSGIWMMVNPMFWVAMLGMTYLLLDPLIKTAYVLRCFYGEALESGEDLNTELKQMVAHKKTLAAGLLIVVLFLVPFSVDAQSNSAISPNELDHSIEEVMNRREFAWRMPRETLQDEKQEPEGPIAAALEWIIDMLGKGVRTLKKWLTKLFEWLENWFPEPERKPDSSETNWMTFTRLTLIMLLVLLLAALTFVVVRIWRRRRSGRHESAFTPAAPLPDLRDDDIKADDLPVNRWLALAAEMIEAKDLRLAMRALYLATLAHLAENEMISIEIYKSNREYEQELSRRAHDKKEMLSVFSKSLTIFEQVWYGMYQITRSEFDKFAANQKRILAVAQK
jgi:hypothetical protein